MKRRKKQASPRANTAQVRATPRRNGGAICGELSIATDRVDGRQNGLRARLRTQERDGEDADEEASASITQAREFQD